MLLKDFNFDCSTAFDYINASTSSWYFIMKFDYMSRRAILQKLCNNSCFFHLISFRTTMSMIHVKKSMLVYFSKIICDSRTKIQLYIKDLYLSFAESKVQFATHGKWQLKLQNRLLGNPEHTDADPRTYCAYGKVCKIFSAL